MRPLFAALASLAPLACSRTSGSVRADMRDTRGRTATPTASAAVMLGPCDRTR